MAFKDMWNADPDARVSVQPEPVKYTIELPGQDVPDEARKWLFALGWTSQWKGRTELFQKANATYGSSAMYWYEAVAMEYLHFMTIGLSGKKPVSEDNESPARFG